MAETSKRNSIAGKVATPKPPTTPVVPSGPSSADLEGLAKSIGARIKVTTAPPLAQTHEGTLFTADPIFNIVAIDTRNAANNSSEPGTQIVDYHVIPFSRIQSFQILALPTTSPDANGNPFASAQPPIGPLDVKRLKAREQAKINKLKEERRHKGENVTPEAQAIYDALNRINMPIRWHKERMVVHEAVIISPPYRPEDCRAPNEKQEVMGRVKKVLEGERKKLKEREERERKTATPVGPRKGG